MPQNPSNYPPDGLLERILNPNLASLDDYLADGGFACDHLDSLQAVVALRESDLRSRTHGAWPVFIRWREFIQQGKPGELVVDARLRDPESMAESKLLTCDPYSLIESLYLAHMATGTKRALIVLDPILASLRPRLLDQVEELKRRNLPAGRVLDLEVNTGTSLPQPAGGHHQLAHYIETWYQIKRILRSSAACGQIDGHQASPTRLITVGGRVNKPGLVEVYLNKPLFQILERAGGLKDPDGVKALAFDSGDGGFLPPKHADIPLAPEELMSAGVKSGLSTVWALGEDRCLVDLTRHALIRLARLEEHPSEASRSLTWHALRLIIQLSLRRGGPQTVEQLHDIARQLNRMGSSAAWPLLSSLRYFSSEWEAHASGLSCVAFDCLRPLVAPCQASCPAGIDIPSFMALVGQGRYTEAVAVMRQDNPLPYICGLVCPAPCETTCLREELDQPISIRAMKAVAARHALAEGGYPRPEISPPSGHKAAVIGGGPAGLTCAYFLALAGHEVTLYEARKVMGGTTFLGIPSYRLPRDVISAEVNAIAEVGVDIQTGKALGRDFSLEDLRDQGCEAIFLGIGAHEGYRLGIPGEDDYPQVHDAITFLRGVAMGRREKPADKVVVVGGGNAAMDAARTCRRLGCEVSISYRRTRAEMPAHEEEIDDALSEGIEIAFLTIPIEVVGDGKRVTGLKCLRAELGPPDDSGRRRPQPVKGSEFVMEAGAVIAAISQRPDLTCLGPWAHDEALCTKTVNADPLTGQTSLGWLYAGGDAVTGPSTVVDAVAAGKRAALAMDAYLQGKPLDPALTFPTPRAHVKPFLMNAGVKADLKRPDIPKLPPNRRVNSFQPAELGLTDDMALLEAQRCLRCDLCIGCGLCQTACAEVGVDALRLSETPVGRNVLIDFYHASSLCIGCGSCSNACPTDAIRLIDDGEYRKATLAGIVLKKLPLDKCTSCGKPYAPEVYLHQVADRLDNRHKPLRMEQAICPDCARQIGARKRCGAKFANLR